MGEISKCQGLAYYTAFLGRSRLWLCGSRVQNNPQKAQQPNFYPSRSHPPILFPIPPKLANQVYMSSPHLTHHISQPIFWTYKISIQTATAMNSRKPNRLIAPLGENNYSPDIANKFNKNYYDVPTESCSVPPLKEFNESPDCVVRRVRGEQFFNTYSIQDLNMELDKNLDDIIALLSKRKTLMAAKKRRILEDAEEKLVKTRHSVDPNQLDFVNDEELVKITSFCQNPRTAVKMLGKIVQTIPNISGPRIDQEERSQQFWGRNRKLQNDIDIILEKLKSIDKQLQKQNGEVLQICRELDRIEETLKSFVGAKSPDHVQKVQPLFNSKKKNYDVLNKKIKEREISKDKKIDYIKRIKNILDELKRTREERLGEIAQFFGIENSWEFDKMNFKEQGDFGTGIEELLKIKERDSQLELSEKEVLAELDILEKDQERIYNELLKRLSDEAKAFHNFNSIQNQRIKYTSILTLFEAETDNFSFDAIDPKEYLKRFKEAKVFFKRFLEEDTLLKQGLVKTSETTKTFVNLLRATENEKERRHELLSLLEACIRKRVEYEQKREEMRTIIFEESRNQQELTQHEEDLEAVLTDGDLEGYRKIGNAIGKCQTQKQRLLQSKEILEKQMESMDRQVLSIANRIQEQYEDILSDVLPSDYEYSLKTGEDVKKLRNQLRKMYKRLGLLTNQ